MLKRMLSSSLAVVWLMLAALPCVAARTMPFNDPALVKQGEYLAIAGDCIGCHTAKGSKPFAGGLGMPIGSFGTVYTSNITPDGDTGIGGWSFDDFDRAVRQGVAKNGRNLYPAMPYVSYAKISDDDMKALYAYFMYGVAPVRQIPRKNVFPKLLSATWPLKIWNWLFLKPGTYQYKSQQSAVWNRGAYLVQGLAHCGTCHTPRGFAMQEKALDEKGAEFLGGSILAGWEAYNITSAQAAGVGGWTEAQLIQYLRTGSVPGVAQVAGPMSEAVTHSFARMTDADIRAIVTYIQTVPPVHNGGEKARFAWGQPATDVARLRGVELTDRIDPARLYLGNCAACHQMGGDGTPDGFYPSLFHNTTVGASTPTNLVQVILHGLKRQVGDVNVEMPAFAAELSDEQIAGLTNYLTRQFGNPATKVTPQEVAKLR